MMVPAEEYATFASIVLDVPARALSEPFTYAVSASLAPALEVGATVVVPLGARMVAG